MKKFVRITAPIKAITSESVCFAFRSDDEVFLKRRGPAGEKVWKLKKDGLYVRRQYADTYGLLPGGESARERMLKTLGIAPRHLEA